MNGWVKIFLDNICLILVTAGCAIGIFAFFINWENFTTAITNGWDLAFGEIHDEWYPRIGNHCYIPLIILICSVISACALIINIYKEEEMSHVMIFCAICGAVMMFAMATLGLTSFVFEGKDVFFANHIGTGTILAWTASVFIMVGGGMYVASIRGREHGE